MKFQWIVGVMDIQTQARLKAEFVNPPFVFSF